MRLTTKIIGAFSSLMTIAPSPVASLAAKLKASNSNLKVIFTSGYSIDLMGADVLLHDGVNFLQKPYHPHKLAKTVRDCLDGECVVA